MIGVGPGRIQRELVVYCAGGEGKNTRYTELPDGTRGVCQARVAMLDSGQREGDMAACIRSYGWHMRNAHWMCGHCVVIYDNRDVLKVRRSR